MKVRGDVEVGSGFLLYAIGERGWAFWGRIPKRFEGSIMAKFCVTLGGLYDMDYACAVKNHGKSLVT
jgi:hypothetical protein